MNDDKQGWRECRLDSASADVSTAIEAATAYARRNLGLDDLVVRLFEPGPRFQWSRADRDVDMALVTLTCGPYHPALKGHACHPHDTRQPTVWVRARLSPALTAAVVLHEARHVWQFMHTDVDACENDEPDAEAYMWAPLATMGFSLAEIEGAQREVAESLAK